MAIAVLIGEIGCQADLSGTDTPTDDRSADGKEGGLFLRNDAEMITVETGREEFRFGRIELVAKLTFDGGQEGVGGPAVLKEKILQSGAIARLAEAFTFLEDVGDGANDRNDLVPLDECVELNGEMRLGGKTSSDAERKADFLAAVASAACGGEANVVDFGIGAPVRAAGDGDFEFAGEIVELRIATEFLINGERDGSDVGNFLGMNAG